MLRVKAVGVPAAAAEPEGRACIDGVVKEPQLDVIATLGTSINLQLTLGCKQNTHIYTPSGARMHPDHVPVAGRHFLCWEEVGPARRLEPWTKESSRILR